MQNHAVSVMFESHFSDCRFGVLYIDLKICFIAPVLLWEAAGEEPAAYKLFAFVLLPVNQKAWLPGKRMLIE